MIDIASIRKQLAEISAQALALAEQVKKDGEAQGSGPTASDVHVPAPLGSKAKKLKTRASAVVERLDKLLVSSDAMRRHKKKQAERKEAARRAAAARAKLAGTGPPQ